MSERVERPEEDGPTFDAQERQRSSRLPHRDPDAVCGRWSAVAVRG
jgi:hypothetical protein